MKRKAKLRKRRIEALNHSLKIRRDYRKRIGLKMRSTSVDGYDKYTDQEYA